MTGSMSIKHATNIARTLQLKVEEQDTLMHRSTEVISSLEQQLSGTLRINWLLIQQLGGSVEITRQAQEDVPANSKTRVHTNTETGDVTIEAYTELTDEEYQAMVAQKESEAPQLELALGDNAVLEGDDTP